MLGANNTGLYASGRIRDINGTPWTKKENKELLEGSTPEEIRARYNGNNEIIEEDEIIEEVQEDISIDNELEVEEVIEENKESTNEESEENKELLEGSTPEDNDSIKDDKEDINETESKEDDIEIIRAEYLEKFGKNVANVKKNDIEWIKGKLAE